MLLWEGVLILIFFSSSICFTIPNTKVTSARRVKLGSQQHVNDPSVAHVQQQQQQERYILDDFHHPIEEEDSQAYRTIASIACREVDTSPWRISLLPSDDLEAAGRLVVDANHQPASLDGKDRTVPKTGISNIAGAKFFSKIIAQQKSASKDTFTKKVVDGFVSRSYGRLLKPTLQWGKDSAIIAAYDQRLPPSMESLVGIVEVYPTSPPYLCNLAVTPRARRTGLAKILCRTVENLTYYLWGASSLTLQVERINEPARRLYESLGYSATPSTSGRIPSLNSLLMGEAHLVTYEKALEGNPISVNSDMVAENAASHAI